MAPDWTPEFVRALTFVLAREGGLADDPADPGGRTFRGVTQRTYDAWRRTQHGTVRDVAQMTPEECAQIYWQQYFCPAVEGLPEVLHLVAFDTAVNMGLGRAQRWGRICAGAPQPQEAFLHLRVAEYRAIVKRRPVLAKFLPGWLIRIRALRRTLGLPRDPTLVAGT